MIYVKTDEEGSVLQVSSSMEPGFISVDNPGVTVSLDAVLGNALYVEGGVLRQRPITYPYYKRRVEEYPPIGDQLDALWKLIQANSDKIDLAEAAPLFEAVQAVKDKYPKPS